MYDVFFFFTQLVLCHIFFFFLYTWQTHVLLFFFLTAVMIKQDTYMNIRMRLVINPYMPIWRYSLQLSSILCFLFVFCYNPHSQWLFSCFGFFKSIFSKLTPFLWTPTTPSPSPSPSIFYNHKLHSVVHTRLVCRTGTERSDVKSSASLLRALQDPLPWAHDATIEERNVLVKLFSCLFHWFLLKFVFPLWFF